LSILRERQGGSAVAEAKADGAGGRREGHEKIEITVQRGRKQET
jgi:hypothetical protein